MFKDVPGYEKYLKVSEDGVVVSKERWMEYPRAGGITKRFKPENVKKQHTDQYGYKRVSTNMDGLGKMFYVHRLVAMAFIPNPENKPQINHKDGVKTNNHVSNLEWCTNIENKHHSKVTGLDYAPTIPNELVPIVKHLYSTKLYTQRELAEIFETQHSNIWWVLNKR